ncbi:hypothetical protein AB6A40_004554 [Gnathostoma spinigerum]|uniref:Aminopeptidase P N-terminal domain-containing protein n=1 Tax=Gnathostoma spinigerum TaxID=75299 RepID=A0ABD6EDZ3_9BILA
MNTHVKSLVVSTLRTFSSGSCRATGITREEFIRRRQNVGLNIRRKAPNVHRDAPVFVVSVAAEQCFSAPDVPYPYRQCSYHRYLTGLTASKTILTILCETSGQTYSILYKKRQTDFEKLWEGASLSDDEIIAASGVDEVRDRSKLLDDVKKVISRSILSFDEKRFEHDSQKLAEVFCSARCMVPLFPVIDVLRWIKSPAEQDLMRTTCSIGSRAMNAMMTNCRHVTNENEIVGRLEYEMRSRGASALAYPPVVAAGNRANTIHYLNSNGTIVENDSVLVDAGCEYDGYVSDITRVFPVGNHFTEPQKELYEVLNETQSTLLRMVEHERPLRLNDLYTAMLATLSKNLTEVGLLPASLSEQERYFAIEKICPHHVSHYLGMDVHDVGTVPRNINIQPGVVFTVEPGIYVRKDNYLARKDFHEIGLRIEDNILITENGYELLTKSCVREVEDVEHLINFGALRNAD